MTNKNIIILVIILIVVLGAIIIFANNNNGDKQVPVVNVQENIITPTVATSTEAVTKPVTTQTLKPKVVTNSKVSVIINNFAFNPQMINIKTGTTVTWTNSDAMSHTVTADSGTALNSAVLAPGQSYSVTFSNPGNISYHCSIHQSMRGTVVVN